MEPHLLGTHEVPIGRANRVSPRTGTLPHGHLPSARWISLANEKISDAALNALELGAADARPPATAAGRAATAALLSPGGGIHGQRQRGITCPTIMITCGGAKPSSASHVHHRAATVAPSRPGTRRRERVNDTDRPAPWYHGTRKNLESIRNAVRRAQGRCAGCTPAQLAAQFPTRQQGSGTGPSTRR